MTEIKINPIFEKLIPSLGEAEFKVLEANILKSGCREPIVLWNGFIIDGHHRYKICKKHNLDFKTVNEPLDSEIEAKMWMIDNQFGRRDVPTFMKIELALQFEDFEKELAQERKKAGKADHMQDFAGGTVRDKIGEKVGVSGEQVRRVKTILKNAPTEEIGELRLGNKSINESYVAIQQAMKPQSANDEPGVKTTIDGKIFINSTFESILPNATKLENRTLEKTIAEHGCTEAIKVWNGVIVDGHRRYRACCKLGVPYATIALKFNSEDEAILWIIDRHTKGVGRQLNHYGMIECCVNLQKILLEEKGIKTLDFTSEEHMAQIYQDARDHQIPEEDINKHLKIVEHGDREMQIAVAHNKMSVEKAYEILCAKD